MADEIIVQKEEIINKMASEMGIPAEKLLETLYEKEAAKKAKQEVDRGLAEPAETDSR